MARKARIFTKSEMYHVIMRGNNKQNLFYDREDFTFFHNRLKKYASELSIDVYGFCFMNNHVHLLLGKANKNLSLFMQKLANSYVYYFNRKYERSGHLFQGRFKSEPVNDEIYFKTVLRYILQNPESGNISTMETYEWNSYKAIMNPYDNLWIKTDYIFSLFGSKNYTISFLAQRTKDICMEYENKIVFSDLKAIKLIKHVFHVSSPINLEQIDPDISLPKIKILKQQGLSINQISRLTGISRMIIKSA